MKTRARKSILRKHPRAGAVAVGLLGVMSAGVMSGCAIGALVGGMAQSYRESSTRPVAAEYTGLEGKSYAVVVAADRTIEADYPGLVAELTNRLDRRLFEHAGATGHVPAADVLAYIYNNPAWAAQARSELARRLGNPDRLIVVDISEFRLNDPGNAYLWDGVAAGSVAVLEIDSQVPDDHAFEKPVQVRFPDQQGAGPQEFTRDQVISVLLKRFTDRASWLFYEHEEPYYPEY